MPTPSEKEAIEILVNFLLSEFTTPETIDAAINNVVFTAETIKFEYSNANAGFLEGFYIFRNSHHEKKLDDLLAQLKGLNNPNIFAKGLCALQFISETLSKSKYWQQSTSQKLQGNLPMMLAAPLQRYLPESLFLKATINFRILEVIINGSTLADKYKETLHAGMERLSQDDVVQLFFSELNNGIAQRRSSANSKKPAISRVGSIGSEVIKAMESTSSDDSNPDVLTAPPINSGNGLPRGSNSNSKERGLYSVS